MQEPKQIASLMPATDGYGPSEAGKQAREKIIVTVYDPSRTPVAGATWRWQTDAHSGWVYPPTGTTAADGRVVATWVAGSPGAGILTLTAENSVSSMTAQMAARSVASRRPPSSAISVWINHADRASGYSIDLTPLTEPAGAYYAALKLGRRLCRPAARRSALRPTTPVLRLGTPLAAGPRPPSAVRSAVKVLAKSASSPTRGAPGNTYRFEITEEKIAGGSALTLHVTDLATGQRRFIATLRYAARADLRGFAMFVEDFSRDAPTCLAQSIRSAAIRRAMARIGGSWQPLTRATLYRHQEDAGNPGTPPCANLAVRRHAAGLDVVMGGRTASQRISQGIPNTP